MKPTYLRAKIFAATLLWGFIPRVEADGGKKGSTHRGGKAESHMSEKGSANTNAQWSADPDHGWLRAEERHEFHPAPASSTNHGNRKGSSQGKKAIRGKQQLKDSVQRKQAPKRAADY
jgi:hypothetical protein